MDTVATFNILSSNDVGYAMANGGIYPPTNISAGTNSCAASRGYNSGEYEVIVGLCRFDTSAIPDDAEILVATLKLFSNLKHSANARLFTTEWYNFSSITAAAYTLNAATSANSGVALSDTYFDVPLSNVSNINKSGYTGFRFHISGGEPTGKNDVNLVWSIKMELEVTYSVGWAGKIFGVTPAKIFGIEPKKVCGI